MRYFVSGARVSFVSFLCPSLCLRSLVCRRPYFCWQKSVVTEAEYLVKPTTAAMALRAACSWISYTRLQTNYADTVLALSKVPSCQISSHLYQTHTQISRARTVAYTVPVARTIAGSSPTYDSFSFNFPLPPTNTFKSPRDRTAARTAPVACTVVRTTRRPHHRPSRTSHPVIAINTA